MVASRFSFENNTNSRFRLQISPVLFSRRAKSSSCRMPPCSHTSLSFSPSPHAASAGYKQPTRQQLKTAAGLHKNEDYAPESTFPAPLVLPGDDLATDPKCPPQSFRSWLREKNRNEVTARRKTIYIADFPRTDIDDADSMRSWAQPKLGKTARAGSSQNESPIIADIIPYRSAFFHPLPVKALRTPLQFSSWSSRTSRKATKNPPRLALSTPTEATLIRYRPCPDGLFPAQLNLNE